MERMELGELIDIGKGWFEDALTGRRYKQTEEGFVDEHGHLVKQRTEGSTGDSV